jgi:hypothetical protein
MSTGGAPIEEIGAIADRFFDTLFRDVSDGPTQFTGGLLFLKAVEVDLGRRWLNRLTRSVAAPPTKEG